VFTVSNEFRKVRLRNAARYIKEQLNKLLFYDYCEDGKYSMSHALFLLHDTTLFGLIKIS
jgi:hypothetical protein